jgi:hypothetical protein
MDTELKRRIKAARRKRERADELHEQGTRELAAALAEARASTARPHASARELAELAGLKSRDAVHSLVRWHEQGGEGSPWRRHS